VHLAPNGCCDALASDHRRLLPALLRFGEEGAQERWRAEAVRYVEFCLVHLRSQDAALHQLAVALYTLQVRGSTLSPLCTSQQYLVFVRLTALPLWGGMRTCLLDGQVRLVLPH
jgi:hypothetical protein